MYRYIIKRVLLAILTVFIVSAITFFGMNAIPGGPFNKEKAPSAEVQAVLEARYNLDKPVPEQFAIYLKNLMKGDMGVSLKTGREISTVIGESFPISARLGGFAVLIATITGLILGSIAALKRNGIADRIIIFFTTLATAAPSFVLATLLLYVLMSCAA